MDSEGLLPEILAEGKGEQPNLELCALCGRFFEASFLSWMQGEGWLCRYCRLESSSCGCEDHVE